MTIGLNPRAQALLEAGKGSTPAAVPGWSVFCNDRAVLVGDTTRLTGWGEPPVPRYHEQYDILTGIVEFRATDAQDLPVTTTKRDLDASSEAWLVARAYMREGARKMVSHTNAWKNNRKEHRELFQGAKVVQMEKVRSAFESGKDSSLLRKRPGNDHQVFNPEKVLPKPPKKQSDSRRIAYSRPRQKVERLGEALLDDLSATPGEVGAECFDFAYRELVGR